MSKTVTVAALNEKDKERADVWQTLRMAMRKQVAKTEQLQAELTYEKSQTSPLQNAALSLDGRPLQAAEVEQELRKQITDQRRSLDELSWNRASCRPSRR